MKALGTGIGFEVSRLDFDTREQELKPDRIIRTTKLKVDQNPVSDWIFEETMIDDHCVSVATRKGNTGSGPAVCSVVFGYVFIFLTSKLTKVKDFFIF